MAEWRMAEWQNGEWQNGKDGLASFIRINSWHLSSVICHLPFAIVNLDRVISDF